MLRHRASASVIAIGYLSFASSPSCTSQPATEEYLTLPARFADEAAAQPLEALDAWRDDTEFFVRYRVGDDIRYTGGTWSDRIDLEALADGETGKGPFILPLGYHRSTPWPESPPGAIDAKILGATDWQAFRDGFVASVLPKDGASGIVLHFFVDDYFLYFDREGVFQSVVLTEKPADYAIVDRISFGDFLESGVPLLERFLAERGIRDRRVVFNTGDTGMYSLPFLYVNLELGVAAFARLEPDGRAHDPGRAVPILQTAGHVTQSHSSAIVFRPISSVYRLFFAAKGVVTETVRPDWLVALDETEIGPLNTGPGMDLPAWERRLDELTGRETSKGTIDYLVDGVEFFPRFVDAVTSAEASIDLRTYIFDNDDFAERIGDLLKRRSNEGVDVRMLFDGFGTIVSTIERQQTLPEDWKGTASVREFLEAGSEIEVRQTPNPWFTGDHVKTIIVDRQVAFTGGMNIAREYRFDWHDLMMEVRGPVVDILQDEFNKAWAHAGFFGDYGYAFRRVLPAPNHAEDVGFPVRVLFTRVDDPEIFRVQREAIRNARRYIYVENAYFTDDAMLYELVKARRRGVDVRVIMPMVTDRGPITRNNALAANVMLEHGIRVFIYPGMSHVKAAVFDGWACLGSANWDKWSLAINKELNLATSDARAVEPLLERLFEVDFAASPELVQPFPERWSDFLLEFLGDYAF
ncbi:MAG: phosphatidylserine/phosphatidylglycerophosphate/cardiolipin synthase family protein [Gammaproteobacteria bacterium]|nr:phosphatidylserine/phosphatidylglycerophosphate/cardiolipin synthase family protein [Gammaproteobacteria bacterium]MDH5344901.1 phosphatidylserine/phosphatidylglycerophosphate/cardiolipin synthase family protein [Gammaproteobacteria bacterium]